MKKQPLLGLTLVALGLGIGTNTLNFLKNFDFPMVWYGLILLLDTAAQRFGARSLFSKPSAFLLLLLGSIPFWWFFEWVNTFLGGWFYPKTQIFGIAEWIFFASISFATVLPAIVVTTNLVAGLSANLRDKAPKQALLSKKLAVGIAVFGALTLLFVLFQPTYLFPLLWAVVFLILDPANALRGKESIIAQVLKGNYQTLLIISLGALLVGLVWESVNYVLPKWTYPLNSSAWFWSLPQPIATKIFQMPLAGYLGYVPFSWSAFSFVKYLGIEVPWLSNKS